METQLAPRERMKSRYHDTWVYFDGEMVRYQDAYLPPMTHALQYGTGCFEGIRAYETPRGTAVFRLTEHVERLANSAQLLYMELPYSRDELKSAVWDLIGANGLPECYLRSIAFFIALRNGSGRSPAFARSQSSILLRCFVG